MRRRRFGRYRAAPDPGAPFDPTPDRRLIVPRIRDAADMERVVSEARELDSELLPPEPLVGNLVVVYCFDRPGIYQMLTPVDLETMSLAPSELRDLAIDNAVRMADGGFLVEVLGPLLMIQKQHAAVTLLIPDFWQKVARRRGDPLVVGVPASNHVIACAMADIDAVSLLATMVADGSDGPPLCEDLLVPTDGGWELLDASDEDGETDGA